jgi:UDP-GalNAc:undecaprenyl-phosphate GalNAc-1-phosphate transferase
MRGFPKMFTLRRLGFQVLYLAIAVSLILWLALGLQAGDSGIYLFVVHDVATSPSRLLFIAGFELAFLISFVAVLYALKLPRFDFLNRIIAINTLTYSFLGLSLSALRLPLISREVFIIEFFVSTVLLVAYYLLKARLFPRRIGVLHGVPIEPFIRHPALIAFEINLMDARSGHFEAVVVNLRGEMTPQITRLLTTLAQSRVPVHDADAFIENLWGRIPLDRLTAIEIETFVPPPIYQKIKRFIELVLIFFFFPCLVVLALIIAAAIRLDTPGPILFRQKRTGYQDGNFTMLKFRSMVVGSDIEYRFAEKKDKRVTRVGAVLRRLRLDELPQLWNVIRGEMSLIGPRPEQEQFTKRFSQLIPFYGFRHTVPPGISGWAQVMYGYAASDEQTRGKLEFDFYYIKHMSAWLDFVILIKTLRTIILGSGAR